MDDEYFMRKALALAERGRGHTNPNPMVGALVVDGDGVIVGRGAHRVAGGPHAEVFALEGARERARGATAYVSLEDAVAAMRGERPEREGNIPQDAADLVSFLCSDAASRVSGAIIPIPGSRPV